MAALMAALMVAPTASTLPALMTPRVAKIIIGLDTFVFNVGEGGAGVAANLFIGVTVAFRPPRPVTRLTVNVS